jgi:uncharacterized OB-fold protein
MTLTTARCQQCPAVTFPIARKFNKVGVLQHLFTTEVSGICLALVSTQFDRRLDMEPAAATSSKIIAIERKEFRAVKCEQCGAKMYPKSLLQPHLSKHRLHQRWLSSELRKLQDTFSRMRDIA